MSALYNIAHIIYIEKYKTAERKSIIYIHIYFFTYICARIITRNRMRIAEGKRRFLTRFSIYVYTYIPFSAPFAVTPQSGPKTVYAVRDISLYVCIYIII